MLFMLIQNQAFSKDVVKIDWVLSHEPVFLFEDAANKLSKIVNERSGGTLQVAVKTVTEISPDHKLTPVEIIEKVKNGEIQMSHSYTTTLGKYFGDFWALDLPFLFRSHEHATKVLEGEAGEGILAGLESQGLKGLGFTYSGGYRIILSREKSIKRFEDFKGLRVAIDNTPVIQEFYKVLGAKTVDMQFSLEEGKRLLETKEVDLVETTYPRLLPLPPGFDGIAHVINETDHSLFLTSFIINKKFFDSLSSEHQVILKEAVIEVARFERERSIALRVDSAADALKKKIDIIRPSNKELARLEKKTAGVAKKTSQHFTKGLVKKLEAK